MYLPVAWTCLTFSSNDNKESDQLLVYLRCSTSLVHYSYVEGTERSAVFCRRFGGPLVGARYQMPIAATFFFSSFSC